MRKLFVVLMCGLFFIVSCGGEKMPIEQFDAVYKTDSEGYPEFLLIKKRSDSTCQFLFYPEDVKMSCQAQRKGIAINKFYKRGPDIVIQEDGSGIATYRFTAENYKCSLVLTLGFADRIKVHSHCNGGNQCPEDAVYTIERTN